MAAEPIDEKQQQKLREEDDQQQPQQQQPTNVVQSGYSLQETWTTFFQQELPVPPGRR